MGQTCCGTKQEEAELLNKMGGVKGERQNYDPELNEKLAALTIQRYFKGLMTRRAIKEMYGFEAKHTAFAMPTYPLGQLILQAFT